MIAVTDLFERNRKWAERMRAADPAFFSDLAKQQSPEYLWIGCSDSRVPANQITGLAPGEVLVHRNIANLVVHTDLNCLSVLQFAIDLLHVKHVIVCGHHGCSGIRAALSGDEVGLADNWLRHVEDVREHHSAELGAIADPVARENRLCELNVRAFGFAYTQPDDMKKQCAWVRAQTDRPFGINLFTSPQPERIDAATQRTALAAVAGYYNELGLPVPETVNAPYAPDLEAQLDAVEEIKPKVFTVHLAALPEERIRRIKANDIILGGSATNIAEAKHLESLGFDFVIAQGGEAGGRRGSYLRDPYQSLTGTLALVRLVAGNVRLPVIAAGGIMDGGGIAAVLALGAQIAQLGTAFIPCPESGAPRVHKDLLVNATEDDTRLTEKFSGKPARGLANRFMREMEKAPQLAFPAQNMVTGKLRQASAKAGKGDFVAMWAGQAAPLSRALPAADLIARLEAETVESIRNLKGVLT